MYVTNSFRGSSLLNGIVIVLAAFLICFAVTVFNTCEEMKSNKETEDTALTIARETGENATVIIKTADGNVYEFCGKDYDIADDHVTIFFE